MSFLKQIFGYQKAIFGLDIGYETLKIVQLKKKGDKFHLVGLGSAPIPKNTILKNAIKEKKVVAEAIKKVISENHIHAKAVVSALPESLVFTRTIFIPKMDIKELKEAVPLETSSFIPLESSEIYLDFSVINENEGKLEVLTVAAPKSLVDDFLSLINEILGLKLVCLETKPMALVRALIEEKDSKGILIVDLGAENTSLTIYDQGNIKLTSTVKLGGETFTRVIAETLSLNQKEAERIKREKGLTEKENEKITQALKTSLSPLVDGISNSIKYFQSHVSEASINKIKLSGGGAHLLGLSHFIQETMAIKTELGDPFVLVENPPKIEGPLQYITALGLAQREI